MPNLIYRLKLTTAAQIWAQKNNFLHGVEAVPQNALAQLQQQDFLELETPNGKPTFFSVVRKTVRVASQGDVAVELLLDHPAR